MFIVFSTVFTQLQQEVHLTVHSTCQPRNLSCLVFESQPNRHVDSRFCNAFTEPVFGQNFRFVLGDLLHCFTVPYPVRGSQIIITPEKL